MINSTLGGLIKDYRLQKGVSQLDIAFALGWKEPSRLSRIEQGKTEKPPQELLEKIITAIGLDGEEKNRLLLTSGYLPTDDEVEKIRLQTDKFLKNWPYPALLIDFSWRLININKHFARVHNIKIDEHKPFYKSNIRVLDLLFDKKLGKNEILLKLDSEKIQEFLKLVILNFKYEQRNRTKEKWYIDHIKSLMNNHLFSKLWVETDVKSGFTNVISKFALKSFIYPNHKDKLLNFYMFIVPVLTDPRFEMELLVPMDLETYQYYQ